MAHPLRRFFRADFSTTGGVQRSSDASMERTSTRHFQHHHFRRVCPRPLRHALEKIGSEIMTTTEEHYLVLTYQVCIIITYEDKHVCCPYHTYSRVPYICPGRRFKCPTPNSTLKKSFCGGRFHVWPIACVRTGRAASNNSSIPSGGAIQPPLCG